MSKKVSHSKKSVSEVKDVEEKITEKKKFNDYTFVEGLIKLRKEDEILKFLSDNLIIPNYLTFLRDSIILDFYIYSTIFCIENRFDVIKSIHFLCLMNELFEKMQNNEFCQEDAMEISKKKILEYTFPTIRKPLEILNYEDESKKKEESARKRKKKPPSSRAKEGVTGRKKKPKQPVVVEEKEPESLPPVFTANEATKMSNFLVTGFLQHYYLYQFAIKEPRPRKVRTVRKMLIYPVKNLPTQMEFLDEEAHRKKMDGGDEKDVPENEENSEKKSEE